MKTISILFFALIFSAVSEAQGEPAIHSNLYKDYTAGMLADYAYGRCGMLIGDLKAVPHWRDNGVPIADAKQAIYETITMELGHSDTDAESESDARYRWRRVIAATPKDISDWNAVIEKLYDSDVTEEQIDNVLKKYCTPHTKHVFRASDLKSLVQMHKKLSVSSVAQGKGYDPEDGAFIHCGAFISYFSMALPMWRDEGQVPLSRAEDRLVEFITNDPPSFIQTQDGLDAWRRVIASTPQEIEDWKRAFESIYNSNITEKQISRALSKYCTPHTKHIFRASDLNSVLSKHQNH